MNIADILKNKPAPKSNITNYRQVQMERFVQKIQAEQKRQNWFRYKMWKLARGQKPPRDPQYIAKGDWATFKKAKLPMDEKYFAPWTARRIAIKLGHVPTEDLEFFYSSIADSPSFLKSFFGKLKVCKD